MEQTQKRRDVLVGRRRIFQASRPSWVSGAARLVDLGGNFDRYRFTNVREEFGEDAMADDLAKIGLRLAAAMRRIEERYR